MVAGVANLPVFVFWTKVLGDNAFLRPETQRATDSTHAGCAHSLILISLWFGTSYAYHRPSSFLNTIGSLYPSAMFVDSPELLWKLPLLAGMAGGMSYSFTSPQPPPSKTETDGYDGSEARETVTGIGSWGPRSIKLLVRCVQAYESYLVLYKVFPVIRNLPLPSWLRPSPATLAQVLKLRVTPSFFVGTAIICLGAYFRSVCFHRLGRQFTFQLSIREDHKLITDGPYSIVRHPAYASAIIQLFGLLMCLSGPGAWFKELGMQSMAGKTIGAIVGVQLTLCTFAGIDRTFREDALLRQIFKAEWEEWAKKTPYKIFPLLF